MDGRKTFCHADAMEKQPPYDPEVYDFVFGKILQHRYFTPLHIDKIYPISVENEADLHDTGSLVANEDTAEQYAEKILQAYPNLNDIDHVVEDWYLT